MSPRTERDLSGWKGTFTHRMNSATQTEPGTGFRTFEDLEVYQHACEFRKLMYNVARWLPDFEKFALATQIRQGRRFTDEQPRRRSRQASLLGSTPVPASCSRFPGGINRRVECLSRREVSPHNGRG